MVLEGRPTLRHPQGSEELEPWDVVFFPRGPEGAHGIRNETEEMARVLMFSTVVLPTATVYPDSDKVGVWTGDPGFDVAEGRHPGWVLSVARLRDRPGWRPLGLRALRVAEPHSLSGRR